MGLTQNAKEAGKMSDARQSLQGVDSRKIKGEIAGTEN